MPSKAGLKRTIKLRQPDAQGREFVRVSAQNKTNWASCNMTPEKPSFTIPIRADNTQSNFYLSQIETNFLIGVPVVAGFFITAAAVSVPVGAVYALSQFQLASTATLVSAAIPANPILAGISSFLGGTAIAAAFLSPDVETAQFTNFNKPCDSVGQGKF